MKKPPPMEGASVLLERLESIVLGTLGTQREIVRA
jgi:hypothetical protein